jgi:hypothetical protein
MTYQQENNKEEEDVHSKISNPPAEGDEDKSSTISASIDDAPGTGSSAEVEEDLPPEATPIPHHAAFKLWRLKKVSCSNYSSCNIIELEEKGSCPVSNRCPCQSHQDSSLS